MVQEFHVVRCCACDSFQVQQVKKANRWSCKVCGQKQSLLKEFGRGSGADCRRHVQRLNAMRGAIMEEKEHKTMLLWEQQVEEEPVERDAEVKQTQVSRWSKYLDTPEEEEPEEEPEEENVLMDRQLLHGNNMTHRKRKRTDTPEQFNSCSLRRKPAGRSATSLTPSSPPGPAQSSPPGPAQSCPPGPAQSSPPGLTQCRPLGLTHTSPSSKKKVSPPTLTTRPVSRWACFLSSACQVQEGAGPSGTLEFDPGV